MRAHLDRHAAVDQTAQRRPRLLPPALRVLSPVAPESQRGRRVFPELVEAPGAAVERGRSPRRAPAEREPVPARAVREHYVVLALQAQHPEHPGDVATTGVGVLGIAAGPIPGHRVERLGVAGDLGHGGLPW